MKGGGVNQVFNYRLPVSTCEPYVVVLLLVRLLVALWAGGVACGLDADHVAVPGGWTHGG